MVNQYLELEYKLFSFQEPRWVDNTFGCKSIVSFGGNQYDEIIPQWQDMHMYKVAKEQEFSTTFKARHLFAWAL